MRGKRRVDDTTSYLVFCATANAWQNKLQSPNSTSPFFLCFFLPLLLVAK
jgi:hypothetical protein